MITTRDEALAPFLLHRLRDPLRCRPGQRAQRIAVQVDHALRQREQVAQRAQRVLRVECTAVLQGEAHGSSRSTARTGEASAAISFRGKAISS